MIRRKHYFFLFIIIVGVILSLFSVKNVLINARESKVDELYIEANRAYYIGDLIQATDQYKKILEYEPDGRALLNLATVYEELGDYQKASAYYLTYVSYAPDSQQARLDLAIAYYNLERITEAEKVLNYFLQIDAIDSNLEREVTYYLSKIAERRGDYSQAIEYANRSLKSDPKYALSMVQKGRIFELLGETKKAITSFLEALRIDGSLKGLHQRLGSLYLQLEDYQRAYYRFDRAIQENKSDLLAKTKLEWLEEKFPEKFVRSTKLPQPKDFPEKVDFIKVDPLEESTHSRQLKIGLAGGRAQKAVIFRVGSDFRVRSENGSEIAFGKAGEIWLAEKKENGQELRSYPHGKPISFTSNIKIEPVDYAPILIHQVQIGEGVYWAGKQDRQYRGLIELIPNPEGLTIVNLVNLEEYLYAVVASEMPASWPVEALKVQAVAARTYTQFNLGKHKSQGFDLCDTVHCTAYNGIAWESKKTRQAVKETLGEILTYEDRPINAVYSANSGGHTEDAKDVWGFDLPYLKAVSTLKDHYAQVFPLEPADLKDWLRKHPEAYSADPQFAKKIHYRWQRKVDRDFIEDRLNIGRLKELKVLGRGKGGSVISILAIGDSGEVELKHSLRSKLGGLRSNCFFLRPEYEDGQLTGYLFYGGGWGHSAGMDQVAAAGMAKAGIEYAEILKFFYTGIELQELN